MSSIPRGLALRTNMAAIPLFLCTNMAAVHTNTRGKRIEYAGLTEHGLTCALYSGTSYVTIP